MQIPRRKVTVQPLRGWQDRIADKSPAEYFQHAVALLHEGQPG